MRIRVLGDCLSARALRGDLSRAGFAVTDTGARYTLHIEEGYAGEILVDSIDGQIDRAITEHLRALTTTPIKVQTAGGIQSEFEIRMSVPPDQAEQANIEKAILRGLLSLGDPRPAAGFWTRLARKVKL